jgi:hypothetical protein
LNERQLEGCRQEMFTAKARTATAVYERLSDVAP